MKKNLQIYQLTKKYTNKKLSLEIKYDIEDLCHMKGPKVK